MRTSSAPSRGSCAGPLILMACALFAASPEAATASDLWCGEHNCYEVLGLLPNATAGEVKKAYFKQSLKWHPDKNPSEEAKNEFAKLAGAYEIISEPRRREDYDYALAHPEEEWLNRARFYRDKYFNSGYMQIGMSHIFLGVVAVGSVFQYLNMYMNFHDTFSEFKQTSQYKTEWKRLASELSSSAARAGASVKKKAALKPGQDDAVDKAVDDELRNLLVAGGSLLVPSVRRVMLVQVFTVPMWLAQLAGAQASWYYRYQVLKRPYSEEDKMMLTEKTLRRLDEGDLWGSMSQGEREEMSRKEVWVPAKFEAWQKEVEVRAGGGKRRQRF